MALKSDGTIASWGWDGWGGLTSPPDGNDFTAIAAGGHHALALRSDGSLVAWGWDSYRQTDPPAGNNFVKIAAGRDHSIALRSDGSVICWGANEAKQASVPTSKIVERYKYFAFGETMIYGPGDIVRTQSAVGNRFMFTGREYDYETGNYYYRARYYSPKLGRFLQTDPISYLGGFNLYTYANNNPMNWIDPFGLNKESLNKRRDQLQSDLERIERKLGFIKRNTYPIQMFAHSFEYGLTKVVLIGFQVSNDLSNGGIDSITIPKLPYLNNPEIYVDTRVINSIGHFTQDYLKDYASGHLEWIRLYNEYSKTMQELARVNREIERIKRNRALREWYKRYYGDDYRKHVKIPDECE